MFLVVHVRIEWRARLQQHNVEASLGQNLGGHTSASSGTNNADVIRLGGSNDLGHEGLTYLS